MRTTALGPSGWTVPAQGLGCMRMGRHDQPGDEAQSADVIHRALDLGVTFLDTADMYGWGRNEEIVGKAIRGRRDEALLCTKGGVVRGPGDTFDYRGDANYLRQAAEASLRRLGVDVIDLYYLHRRDPRVPIEDSVGAMAALVAEGKVRHLGLSEVTADELRDAHAVHPITALQSQWSLCARRIEAVLPVCHELGVGVIPYCPQGHGLLIATGDSAAAGLTAIDPRYAALPNLLADIAGRHHATPGQIALAWVHHRDAVWGVGITPIPGTTRAMHLVENIAAADIVLDPHDLQRLDTFTAPRDDTAA